MPPLSQWYIPRPWGARIGLLSIGYIVVRYLQVNDTVMLVGQLMWQVFATFYMIQGLAYINYTQKKRGTSKFWRVTVIIAAFIFSDFMMYVLIILGVIDQVTNVRGLRPQLPPRDNQEE